MNTRSLKSTLLFISHILLTKGDVQTREVENPADPLWISVCVLKGNFDYQTQGYISAKYLNNNRKVEIMVDIDFKNFNDVKKGDSLEWSLNTSWNSGKTSLAGRVGTQYIGIEDCTFETVGYHYDPQVKCGPLSEKVVRRGQSQVLVVNENFCFKQNGDLVLTKNYKCRTNKKGRCERGDLSGKFGKLTVSSQYTTYKKVVDNGFVSKNEASNPKNTYSFVLYKNNEPVLCAKALYSCGSPRE